MLTGLILGGAVIEVDENQNLVKKVYKPGDAEKAKKEEEDNLPAPSLYTAALAQIPASKKEGPTGAVVNTDVYGATSFGNT